MKVLYPLWFVYLGVAAYFSRALSVKVTAAYLSNCMACSLGGHGFNDYRIMFHILIFTVVTIPVFTYAITENFLKTNESSS